MFRTTSIQRVAPRLLNSTLTSTSSSTHATTCLSSATTAACTPTLFSRSMAGMAGRDVRMRVLLKEDSKLGLKHDIVDVKRGYGRNVLIRRGRAVYATEENKYLSQLQQYKDRVAKLAVVEASQQADDSSAATSTSSTASSTGASALPIVHLDGDALRYQMDVQHKLSSFRGLTFYRATEGGRETSFQRPVTTKNVYVKLTAMFPSLHANQITFSGPNVTDTQSVNKTGEYQVDVALPGLAKPASFKIVVKKLEAAQKNEIVAGTKIKASKLKAAEAAAAAAI